MPKVNKNRQNECQNVNYFKKSLLSRIVVCSDTQIICYYISLVFKMSFCQIQRHIFDSSNTIIIQMLQFVSIIGWN